MVFIKLDADTVLNADAIDRIDLNHVHPTTQERCIRLELRAVPGLSESRIALLKYSATLEAALLKELNPRHLSSVETDLQDSYFEIELACDSSDTGLPTFSTEPFWVSRIPVVGDFLAFRCDSDIADLFVQVYGVVHELAITGLEVHGNAEVSPGHSRPRAMVLVHRCEAPHPYYKEMKRFKRLSS